jgi:hypothetical protein
MRALHICAVFAAFILSAALTLPAVALRGVSLAFDAASAALLWVAAEIERQVS